MAKRRVYGMKTVLSENKNIYDGRGYIMRLICSNITSSYFLGSEALQGRKQPDYVSGFGGFSYMDMDAGTQVWKKAFLMRNSETKP